MQFKHTKLRHHANLMLVLVTHERKNYDIECDCVVVVCRLELCLWSVAMIKIRRDWIPWVEFRQICL